MGVILFLLLAVLVALGVSLIRHERMYEPGEREGALSKWFGWLTLITALYLAVKSGLLGRVIEMLE